MGGISHLEILDVTKHPTMYRTAPTAKNCPAQNVSCAEAEETRFIVCKHYLPEGVPTGK